MTSVYFSGVLPPNTPCALYNNVLEDYVDVTVDSETDDGAGLNALSQSTNDYWIPDTLPATMEVQVSGFQWADCLGITSHNLGSTSTTVGLDYYIDGAWVTYKTFNPENDNTLMFFFPRVKGGRFRITLSGSTSTPSLGYVSVGERINFTTGILPSYTPMYMSHSYELLQSMSRNGNFLTNRVISKGGSTSFQLNILDRDFIEADDFQAFRTHHNEGKAYFFASNPTDFQKDVGYVWRTDGGELNPQFTDSTPFYTCQMNLEVFL